MAGTRGFGVDIGGSGIKGCVVDLKAGKLDGERIRTNTPQPSTPDAVADVVAKTVEQFDWHGPVGITLPTVVKHGKALSAANIDKHWIGTDANALALLDEGDLGPYSNGLANYLCCARIDVSTLFLEKYLRARIDKLPPYHDQRPRANSDHPNHH